MKLSDYDFHLPEERIAQAPAAERDLSRLLVVHRDTGAREHRHFRDILDYLAPGDLLVLNDTKVIPARLYGVRPTGARIEVLLLEETTRDRWVCLVRPGRKAQVGTTLHFGEGFSGHIDEVLPDGSRMITLQATGEPTMAAIARHGELPLPPYIQAKAEDPGRYQTVYAREEGAVAAPTAGLHFTPALLEAARAKGVEITQVTLHTGMGTFKPVSVEDLTDHEMHAERYRLSAETVEAVARTKARGGRVIAVGTTAVRTLEHCAESGELVAGSGETRIFIYPGYRFRVVDALVTNFHLPKSTLLMLVSAFADQKRPGGLGGRELMLETYAEAIAEAYRFYSFGDATLML
ncbi:tRNA preQ1(34) S-adenosylmethionine ribosyltransferase-isomerase QueA [bacterium]|nr:tRNA preQ1(34) S-adenosylmethionine ribosyltransferase-isomerase QueA [bacterium]